MLRPVVIQPSAPPTEGAVRHDGVLAKRKEPQVLVIPQDSVMVHHHERRRDLEVLLRPTRIVRKHEKLWGLKLREKMFHSLKIVLGVAKTMDTIELRVCGVIAPSKMKPNGLA